MKPYPMVTLHLNQYGSLEVYKGRKRYLYTLTHEPELYIQNQDDVKIILDNLPEETRKEVKDGWLVRTHFFNDMYFGDDR